MSATNQHRRLVGVVVSLADPAGQVLGLAEYRKTHHEPPTLYLDHAARSPHGLAG
jgi:hypothetical protein